MDVIIKPKYWEFGHSGEYRTEDIEFFNKWPGFDIDDLIDNMHRLVMSPGEEIIHVIPQEYIIDKESGIKNPIGHAGIRLEGNFHIITGQVAAVKNIFKCVDRAGYKTVDLHLEPLASADAVLSDEEKVARNLGAEKLFKKLHQNNVWNFKS